MSQSYTEKHSYAISIPENIMQSVIIYSPGERMSLCDKMKRILELCICYVPCIYCNIHYGFGDFTCENVALEIGSFGPKTYLVVSGITWLAYFSLIALIRLKSYNDKHFNKITEKIKFYTNIFSSFSFVWTILGSIVFWGGAFNRGHCNGSISTYIFVFLILNYVYFGLDVVNENVKDNEN